MGRLTALVREVAGSQRTRLSSRTSAYGTWHLMREGVQSNLGAGRGDHKNVFPSSSGLLPTGMGTGEMSGPQGEAGKAWLPGPTHTLSLEILWVCAHD